MNMSWQSTLNLLNLHFGDKTKAFSMNPYGKASSNASSGLIVPNPAVDQFKPSDIKFHEPDWNDVMSKTESAMSEEEFVAAIKAQAKKDFENGYRRAGSTEAGNLMRQYVQTVSPDRKGLYAANMAKTGGKLNQTHAIWDGGERVLTFNTSMNRWMVTGTKKEMSQMQQFYKIYNEAYKEAMNGTNPNPENYKSDAKANIPPGAGYSGRA